jgi:hypothetical protein
MGLPPSDIYGERAHDRFKEPDRDREIRFSQEIRMQWSVVLQRINDRSAVLLHLRGGSRGLRERAQQRKHGHSADDEIWCCYL